MRKVHIGETIWKYKIGNENIVIRDPDNKSHVVSISKLVGIPQHDIERAISKKYLHITPQDIKDYIISNLLSV